MRWGSIAESKSGRQVKLAMDDKENDHEQGKRGGIPGSVMDGARIISYNLNEGERPGGVKIRMKIRVESGRKGRVIDARQAQAIREYLRWVRQYRSSGGPGTSRGAQG
jgi:hypothetical protein